LFGEEAADTDVAVQEPPAAGVAAAVRDPAAVPVRPAGGARARAAANLCALALLSDLDGRPPTAEERAVLARWCGWGAVPQIFDDRDSAWAADRDRLRDLVGEDGYSAARAGVLNGHYTHPDLAAALWDGVQALGFTGGRVLNPGCGAGAFIAAAPAEARMVGVELDPATAAVCAALHPDAKVVAGRSPTRRLRAARSTWPSGTSRSPTSSSTIPCATPQRPRPHRPGNRDASSSSATHAKACSPSRSCAACRSTRRGPREP
jgi:hypothetical protein